MHKLIAIVTVAAAIVLGYLVSSFSPSEAGPLGVLAFFISLYVVLVFIMMYVVYYGVRATQYLMGKIKVKGQERIAAPITARRSYYYGTVLGLAPVILLAIQSVGGITVYDVVLVLLFSAMACFYITRRT